MADEATAAPEEGGEGEGGMLSAEGAPAAEGVLRGRRPLRSSMAPKIQRSTVERLQEWEDLGGRGNI